MTDVDLHCRHQLGAIGGIQIIIELVRIIGSQIHQLQREHFDALTAVKGGLKGEPILIAFTAHGEGGIGTDRQMGGLLQRVIGLVGIAVQHGGSYPEAAGCRPKITIAIRIYRKDIFACFRHMDIKCCISRK